MKTALVTGANKSIGFETAKRLAQLGHFVYIGSRDKTKGSRAIEKLKMQVSVAAFHNQPPRFL
jgi:NAD(P)-dependent dehydrogenase (short-subunit alcohol dehydrogenase family)